VNKKKLLFIVNVDWSFITFRLPIALKAISLGYEVHVICKITDRAEYLEALGLVVHPFEFSRSGKNIFRELACCLKLYQLMKRLKPDLVHLVTIKPVLYGGIVARMIKVPSVVSAISGLGFVFSRSQEKNGHMLLSIVLILYRLALGHSNQTVIFQNPSDLTTIVEGVSLPTAKVKLICGSGVDLSNYPVTPEVSGKLVIAMASRLLRDKGVLEFIDAARIVKNAGSDVCFQLIGEPDFGNPESVTVDEVRNWKAEGIVECLGFRTDIAELFAQAHIVVLPSYREGLPKVLMEAAACGRAVITTDVPGCRDAIEQGVTGDLVPARNAKALAAAVELLIKDSALRQRMGRAGRDLAEREFSIDKVVNAHFDIYQELQGNKAVNE